MQSNCRLLMLFTNHVLFYFTTEIKSCTHNQDYLLSRTQSITTNTPKFDSKIVHTIIAAKCYSRIVTKIPNIVLCLLHLFHALMGLRIFSSGYAQVACRYCLVTSAPTRQTSLMQVVTESPSAQHSGQILFLSIQKVFNIEDSALTWTLP